MWYTQKSNYGSGSYVIDGISINFNILIDYGSGSYVIDASKWNWCGMIENSV